MPPHCMPPHCMPPHFFICVHIVLHTHTHSFLTGKFGDGSDVTTWKINFRCALNGLKDIIERRELEEPDCRVYQMLPSTNTGRRRKRRRTYYSEILSYQPPDKDMRPRLDAMSPNGSSLSTPTPTSSKFSRCVGGWDGVGEVARDEWTP